MKQTMEDKLSQLPEQEGSGILAEELAGLSGQYLTLYTSFQQLLTGTHSFLTQVRNEHVQIEDRVSALLGDCLLGGTAYDEK